MVGATEYLYGTPESLLARWQTVVCSCDPTVDWQCEACNESHILATLVAERDRLKETLRRWSYCASQGMLRECPEQVEELANDLLACGIAPYYVRTKTLETVRVS